MRYCIQQWFKSLVTSHIERKNMADMVSMHTQWDVRHNQCYVPNKIGTVTGGSGSVETAAVHSVNAELHTAVFQITDTIIQGREKHL